MRSDRTQRRTHWKVAATTFTFVLVFLSGLATPARAQVPPDAALYGVHETKVLHVPQLVGHPFRDVTLNATYTGPSGQVVNFWGFYDGDGEGGMGTPTMTNTVWRIRFMPTAIGNWTVSWWFTGTGAVGSGSGSFVVNDTGIPGPAKLDPANQQLLADARGNPIHWRGYSIKHLGAILCCDPPLEIAHGTALVDLAVDPHLIAGGYNATYVAVPTGWKVNANNVELPTSGLCNPLDAIEQQTDCPLWGDYNYYSMRASHAFDEIIKGLHQRRIWTVGWITFGLQSKWGQLKLAANYQPLMRYFVARYGAYYNYFMWSPTWEIREMGAVDAAWETNLNNMMSYLSVIDPWHRLQGAHDQARTYWEGWQSILPRQSPSRAVVGTLGLNGVNGNHRMAYATAFAEGIWDGGLNYPNVIIGAEDIWEFCSGMFGKPRNAIEVKRGLMGGLFANVLPMYDELVEFDPPCPPPSPPALPGTPGLSNGAGDIYVRGLLDWWYATVNYRSSAFTMQNDRTSGAAICSGIPGQEYVLYKQDGGVITLNLTGAPGTFAVTAKNLDDGTEISLGLVPGGGPLAAPSPFGAIDTLLFVKKQP